MRIQSFRFGSRGRPRFPLQRKKDSSQQGEALVPLETAATLTASRWVGNKMNYLLFGGTLAREGVVLASLAGVLLLGALLVFVLRTGVLPVCWSCGHHSVRRSHSHRFFDAVARICFLYPHRCEKCLQRFYCFRSRRVPRQHSGTRSIAAAGRS